MSATRKQPREVVRREHEHAEHPVGAVDQGEALLRGQGHGLDARGGQRGGGREALAAVVGHVALADERERAVRERRQVAARAERAVLGHDRREAGVQQREHRLGHDGPGPRAAHRQGAGAQEQHRAHDLALDRGAHPGGVRAHQRSLELLAPLGRDGDVGERAEAGRDAVGGLLRSREPRDDLGRLRHCAPGILAEDRVHVAARHRHDVGGREPLAVHGHGAPRRLLLAVRHLGRHDSRRGMLGSVLAPRTLTEGDADGPQRPRPVHLDRGPRDRGAPLRRLRQQ